MPKEQHEFDQYAQHYETVIDQYVEFSGQSQDFYTRAKADHLRLILERKPSTARLSVLDIGCGHGLIHPYLNDTRYLITGIDVAEEAIKVARHTNPHVLYDQYDGTHLPYADDSFDVAFTICVMHHVPVHQWDGFVSEARRVLRPGGTFVVFEHNKLNPLVQWVVRRHPFDRNAVMLTAWRARKLMQRAGFRQVECTHILFFPFEGPLFRRIEGFLPWLPMGAQYFVTGIK